MNSSSTFFVKSIFVLSILLLNLSVFAQETEELVTMSLEDLLNMEVLVATKSAEKLSDAPGIVSVLSRDELERFGGTTLYDILLRVPGLSGSTVYMTDRSMVAPRGDQVQASSAHVLLLINGRPVRESLEGGIKSEILETFPTNIIERIEVIKGPGSVLYGSNAFSAVINIITETPEKTSVYVSSVAGVDGAYGIQGDIKLKFGDFNVVVAGRYFEKSEWKTDYSARDTIPNQLYTFGIKIPNKGPGMFIHANYGNLSIMGSYNQWTNYFIIPDYIPVYQSYGNADWEKLFGNIGYDFELTDYWNISANVTYTNSKFEVIDFPDIKRDSYDFIAEVTNFIKLSDKSNLVIGGLYNKVDGNEKFYFIPNTVITISDSTRWAVGLYAQLDYMLMENLKAIGGTQFNKIEGLDQNLVPRIGLVYYPVSKVNIKALYSEAFRAPSINEFSLKHPELLGDPKLESETIGTIDLSVGYQGDNLQASINYFKSQMEKVIYQDRTATPAKYANGGKVNVQGVEFEGKYYVNEDLYLLGSALYHDTEDENGNSDITPIADVSGKAGISYTWSKAITISLFDIYQGEMSDFFQNTPNPDPNVYNLLFFHGKLNINKLFNLNMNQKFSVLLQVDNVLDEEVWQPAWGLAPGQALPFYPGRAIYVGLNAAL